MFKEQDFEVVGFDSYWKNEKVTEDQNTQTTKSPSRDIGINSVHLNSVQVQTDAAQSNLAENVDMEKLGKWLKNIYPKVANELNDTSLTSALATCNVLNSSPALSISLLQTINTINERNQTDKQYEGAFISALSWNCTGNTLAVACSLRHDIWCYHQGEVKLYTFIRNDKLPEVPCKKLITSACISAMSFHPTQASILCAGTISGEIYLWNIQNDGDSLLSSYTGHDDRISVVSWVTTADTKPLIVLVTASLDSSLILWKISDTILHVDQRYKPQHYTHKMYISNVDSIPKKTERGIVHFDFSPHIPGLFVVGMEGGFILKCSILGAKQISDSNINITGNKTTQSILDPYVSSYDKHEGEINTTAFSPHRKDLFLSCGTDDQIKIFNINQESPVQIIFVNGTVTNVTWVLCESKLLFAAGEDGALKLFSLLNGQQIPTYATFTNQTITSVAVNNKRVNTLVVGDNEGILKLWSVPWNDIAIEDSINVLRNKQ